MNNSLNLFFALVSEFGFHGPDFCFLNVAVHYQTQQVTARSELNLPTYSGFHQTIAHVATLSRTSFYNGAC